MKKKRISIWMKDALVVGDIYLRSDSARVSDYFNQKESKFVSITSVELFDKKGDLIKEKNFLCINKDLVEIVEVEGEKDENV